MESLNAAYDAKKTPVIPQHILDECAREGVSLRDWYDQKGLHFPDTGKNKEIYFDTGSSGSETPTNSQGPSNSADSLGDTIRTHDKSFDRYFPEEGKPNVWEEMANCDGCQPYIHVDVTIDSYPMRIRNILTGHNQLVTAFALSLCYWGVRGLATYVAASPTSIF